jgi:hypothetical protein
VQAQVSALNPSRSGYRETVIPNCAPFALMQHLRASASLPVRDNHIQLLRMLF